MSTSFNVEPAPARLAGVAAGLAAPLFAVWRAWRSARRQSASLGALSDAQLRDIGFRRDHDARRIVRRS